MTDLSVVTPETYLNVRLNRVVNSATALSGQYSSEFMAVNTPYQIEVGISPGKSFSDNRHAVASNENSMNDHSTFTYTPTVQTMFQYMGDVDDIANVGLASAGATIGQTTIYVDTTAVTGSPSGNLVKAGSWVQADQYPYQVAEDVAWTSSANVAIPITRQVLENEVDVVKFEFVRPGETVSWVVQFAEFNNYTIQPHDLLQYTSPSMKFIEVL